MATDAIVAVFTRAPVLGSVKSRLMPVLGEQGALEAHVELLRHTLENLCGVDQFASVEIWCAGDPGTIPASSLPFPASVRTQTGQDLGERMLGAVSDITARGAIAVLVGSDCPVLDATYVAEAVRAVRGGADVVLGPAADGGYVLIAMAHPHAELFSGVRWGRSTVLAETLQRAKALELRVHRLAVLWDVDLPEDWERYRRMRTH